MPWSPRNSVPASPPDREWQRVGEIGGKPLDSVDVRKDKALNKLKEDVHDDQG